MKNYCKFCEDAFVDVYEVDTRFNPILEKGLKPIGGYLSLIIDDEGSLKLTFSSASVDRILSKKKIKYCPMCGRKIEHPTPTVLHGQREE